MVYRIEQYENMPFKESKSRYCARKYKYLPYHFHKGNWGINKNPYNIERRIFANNIGKSFSLAFSYYCSKVEKRYQHLFLDNFINTRWRRGGFNCSYFIDENDIIQEVKKERSKSKPFIQSKDYKILPYYNNTELKDLHIYNYLSNNKILYSAKQYNKCSWLPKNLKIHSDNIEWRVVSGWIKYFDNKQHREYKRHYAEILKNSKSKFKKIREQKRKEIEIGLLSKFSISKSAKKELKRKMEAERREKEKLAKEEMKLILQRKGFRLNAFTNKINDIE